MGKRVPGLAAGRLRPAGLTRFRKADASARRPYHSARQVGRDLRGIGAAQRGGLHPFGGLCGPAFAGASAVVPPVAGLWRTSRRGERGERGEF